VPGFGNPVLLGRRFEPCGENGASQRIVAHRDGGAVHRAEALEGEDAEPDRHRKAETSFPHESGE
jgi:hypothetical protein